MHVCMPDWIYIYAACKNYYRNLNIVKKFHYSPSCPFQFFLIIVLFLILRLISLSKWIISCVIASNSIILNI